MTIRLPFISLQTKKTKKKIIAPLYRHCLRKYRYKAAIPSLTVCSLRSMRLYVHIRISTCMYVHASAHRALLYVQKSGSDHPCTYTCTYRSQYPAILVRIHVRTDINRHVVRAFLYVQGFKCAQKNLPYPHR